ncbi:glycosyltransferase [Aerococcus urinaeequi]|uniref:Glycosyltransferase 2-like domain-containing protein n=1 Tax=Aerococcus urinaeequi TaxID=51665 RepID=A0AAC8WZR9_9LACT|nr:glycosyltransferase [Aerococcus urinaeequi]AMB97019.1 hypothetical protein AWM74_01675 [Aerococcus urinaeequi]
MNNPLVSIVMPVYNVENYLEEALDSIFLQTYKNIELIAVNDGSTDNSKEILERFIQNNPLQRYKIINQSNKGLSGARNTGIKNITGKYTYFFDSDDKITPNSIQELVEFAEKNNTDIVRFNAISFYDNDYSNTSKELPVYDEPNLQTGKVYKRDEYVSVLDRIHSPVWLYFYKSELIKDNKLTFYYGILHEDELFTPVAMFYAKRIGYLGSPFFHRRYRTGSIMTLQTKEQSKKHLLGYMTVVKELHKFEVENKLDLAFKKYFERIYKRIGTSIFGAKDLKIRENLKLIELGVNPFRAINKKIRARGNLNKKGISND